MQDEIQKHDISNMEEILECCDGPGPFDGLETQYYQRKYYKEHFNLLVSDMVYYCMIQLA